MKSRTNQNPPIAPRDINTVDTHASPPARPRWTTWLFIGLPVWLVLSAGAAIWWQFRKGPDSDAGKNDRRFTRTVSEKQVAGDLFKLREYMADRNTRAPESAKTLALTAKWIESTLGPSNTGYHFQRTSAPGDAPILRTTLPGKKSGEDLWLATAYDTPHQGVKDSTALATLLAVAAEMAADQPQRSVHFLFLPHGNDLTASSEKSLAVAAEEVTKQGKASSLLYLDTIGGPALRVAAVSRDDLPPSSAMLDLASVDESPLATDETPAQLKSHGLPVVKIFSGPASSSPTPAQVARNASALVEFVRRLANRL